MDKVIKTEELIKKLKMIARKSIKQLKYEKSLSAISSCANILYEFNQRYKDDEIENMLIEIAQKTISVPNDFFPSKVKPVQTVLFYDGFGLDLRGLAANMTKNIASLGYKLIYVTKNSSKGRQPHIIEELEGFNVEYIYIDTGTSYLKWAQELNQVFIKYSPQVAYFYTTPYDVSGTVVFNRYKDRVIRFLVNLTDHAFWIGLNAFDYCTASRDMSAFINLNYRGIPISKMYRNKSNIFIPEKTSLGNLPFDTKVFRFVFSGGALYKTLGDSANLFYKMIEHIVENHADVNFLYAGEGDDSKFVELTNKYPDRVFLIHEREDFFQIIQKSVFFLNTYPMFGGQMMRYAAYAGKVPVTLKHNDDGEGILINQSELDIEYSTYDEIIKEIDKLLTDDGYRKKKEEKMKQAVVSKETALENYRKLIETQTSPCPVTIENFDTAKFKQEYIDRLNYKQLKENCIVRPINKALIGQFPFLFFNCTVKVVIRKCKRKFWG